jgi:hypothetical protein
MNTLALDEQKYSDILTDGSRTCRVDPRVYNDDFASSCEARVLSNKSRRRVKPATFDYESKESVNEHVSVLYCETDGEKKSHNARH